MFWKKKRPAADGNGQQPGITPPAGDDLRIAREALAQGDPEHAVQHLAWVLNADAAQPEARALLDRAIRMARDPLALAPWGKNETPYSIVAVRAYIHVWQHQLDQALGLMAQIYQAVPGIPFLPWVIEWCADGAQLADVQPATMAFLISSLSSKLSDDAGLAERTAISLLLPAFRQYQAQHPQAGQLAAMLSSLLRKCGRLDEAVALAQAAYATEPGYLTAVLLGSALRHNGDIDAAVDTWRNALRYDPEDLAIRLDIGDTLCATGQIEAGLAAYQEVLERQPEHPWAWPSSLYYRHVLQPDGPWEDQLRAYANAHQDNQRAGMLADRLRPYIASLPEPSDATINALRQLAEQGAGAGQIRIGLSALEAPSAVLAIACYQQERFGASNVSIQVAEIQRPDPRQPRGQVDYLLWRYDGTQAHPAVPPPTPDVAATVASLAALPYEANDWAARATALARTIGAGRVNDLLGVMVHPPARQDPFPIWAWVQRVQLAAAFIIAQLDSGWEGSLRRRVLLSLARGPMDWSVEAAIIALGQLGLDEPGIAPEVGALYLELLRSLPGPGGVPYLNALLVWSFALPDATPALRREAERSWKVMM